MISLGTSSWLFDAWRGPFYPANLPRKQYLPFYTTQFRTVEVNTSFYGQPRPSTIENWQATAPPGFTFSLKFPRVISHEKRLVDCFVETQSFLTLLRSLGSYAAPAFLQLPPSLTRARAGRALADYLAWLAQEGADLRLAVEVRAPDLLTPAFVAYLLELNLAPVLVDRVDTPDLYPSWLEAATQASGPRHIVIRWIGDDVNGPQGDDALTAPRDADLARWADRLAALEGQGFEVFGYMHNPYEGHAPAGIRRLEARLAQRMTLPRWEPAVAQSFTSAKASSAPAAQDDTAGQLSLFDK